MAPLSLIENGTVAGSNENWNGENKTLVFLPLNTFPVIPCLAEQGKLQRVMHHTNNLQSLWADLSKGVTAIFIHSFLCLRCARGYRAHGPHCHCFHTQSRAKPPQLCFPPHQLCLTGQRLRTDLRLIAFLNNTKHWSSIFRFCSWMYCIL